MKILANDGISVQAEQTLINAGFEVQNIKVAQNQLSKYINEQQIDILLVRSATKVYQDVINSCPSLKVRELKSLILLMLLLFLLLN